MATVSALVTHSHAEGIADTVAAAEAVATATSDRQLPPLRAAIWQSVFAVTLAGSTLHGSKRAGTFDPETEPDAVAKAVGCGYDVSSQDTVPFAIWNACRCLHDFREAFLSTVEIGGDCDNNAAIVCGIVASYGTLACIPEDWRNAREGRPAKV